MTVFVQKHINAHIQHIQQFLSQTKIHYRNRKSQQNKLPRHTSLWQITTIVSTQFSIRKIIHFKFKFPPSTFHIPKSVLNWHFPRRWNCFEWATHNADEFESQLDVCGSFTTQFVASENIRSHLFLHHQCLWNGRVNDWIKHFKYLKISLSARVWISHEWRQDHVKIPDRDHRSPETSVCAWASKWSSISNLLRIMVWTKVRSVIKKNKQTFEYN